MALNAAIVWEVRTTGNANNGGGFKTDATGTDYSQQDSAQYALTLCTTAAANAIILNSNAAAVMVGNVCQVISGTNFTPGFYEIISVVAGVSITVDRNCTIAAGASGVVNVGGALGHPNTIGAVAVAGNTIWIKSGTYVKQGSNAYVLSYNSNCTWKGYASTRGDNPTGDTRPYFDGANNTTNCISAAVDTGIMLCNIRVGIATSDGITDNNASGNSFLNYVSSKNNGGSGFSMSAFNAVACESANNTSYGFCDSGGYRSTGYYYGCYVHDNSAAGFYQINQGQNVFFCISESNSGTGFFANGGNNTYLKALCCVAYNNTGASSDGFLFYTDYINNQICLNCISMSNGRYGYCATNQYGTNLPPYFDYNCYYGNGTAGLYGITAGAKVVTSNPSFTDAPNGNFTLATGSPCLNVGFPQTPMAGATI